MFAPAPSALSLTTMLVVCSHDRLNHPECDHIAVAIDVDESEAHHTILKRCPECKVLDRNHHIPAVREPVHRQRLGMAAHDMQEHKRSRCVVEKRNRFCMVTNTKSQ